MSAPCEVLRQFLCLCSSDGIYRLEGYLASNAILEWKGVTVKGRSRIVKFMRHKQQDGLVQRFSNAEAVSAFEERDTHLSTISTPPENFITQPAADHPSDRASSESYKESASPDPNLSFETPPRLHSAGSEPPPLTAGHQFIPFSSSDEDDDDGPPQLTPQSPGPSAEPRQNTYSELQYLEAIGIVRSFHESKHRGTRTSHHIPRDDTSPEEPATPATSTDSADSPDKRTKLKLSYRLHRQTADPQFALIIYEDLMHRSSKVRRNLFCDDPDPEPISPIHSQPSTEDSPEARPLPDTPPPSSSTPPPGQNTPPQTPLEPPGTPHRRRRIPPAGFRSSPRRSRAIMNFTIATDGGSNSSSSSSSSSGTGTNTNNNNNLQTWPRKTHPGGGSPAGGSAAKNRKLASGPTTIRKPLRF
nr:proline-rich receptor-like protein kinase PERK9 [Aedes albopictus]